MPPPTPPPPPHLKRTIYTGTFISTPTPTTLEVLENHAIAVDENGVITHQIAFPAGGGLQGEGYGPGYDDVVGWAERNWGLEGGWEWVRVGEGVGRGWWFPGFVGEWDFCWFVFVFVYLFFIFFIFAFFLLLLER